ncbi:septation ring formation regulator EzrA [Paenibacillus gorillae]|uniref:septation ring formation regulator EzrA n=1 Tax=Paenibacillus gorillae TaxID=1243662 RepID=UPI0004B4F9A0|nr:septation ring formation regulator EzrA [Paenibacillus gorillae]
MKRFILLLPLILMLAVALPGALFAAAVPDKPEGHIKDAAAMLDESRLDELEQAAQSGLYQFYVLTINSLDGEDSAAFATKAYKTWKLHTGDVLLVISKQERRIEMNFNNPGLQAAIEQLPNDYDGNGDGTESKLTELVNLHFIPSAKNGDFVQASISLMEAVNVLEAPPIAETPDDDDDDETGAVGSGGSGASQGNGGSGGSDRPIVTNPSVNQQPVLEHSRSQQGSGFVWVLVVCALIGALWAAAVSFFKLRKLARQKERTGRLMVEVENANADLKPFVGLTQGKTEQLVASIDQSLSELLVGLDQLRTKAESERIFPLHYPKLNAVHNALKAALDGSESKLSKLRGEIGRIVEADANVRKTTDDLHERLPELRKQTDEWRNRLSYSLQLIYTELDRLAVKLEEADRLEVFDPIEANRIATESWTDSGTLLGHIGSIERYMSKHRDFAAVTAERRAEIERITDENGIRKAIMRLNPFALLDQARVMMEKLNERLREGAMDEVIQLGDEADRLLAEAVGIANRQAELKKLNRKDIDYLEEKQKPFQQDISELEQQFSYIRSTYSRHHWLQLYERFEQMKADVQEAAHQLPELNLLTGDSEQHYDRARELIDGWLSRYHECDDTIADCRGVFRELDERQQRVKRSVDSLWSQFDGIQALVRREALPLNQGWQQSYSVIEESYGKLSRVLSQPPLQMDEIESELQQFEGDIHALQGQVNRKLEEKREAERRIREAQAMYDNVYRRAGSKINRHTYSSNFNSLSEHTKQMIAAGMYAQAISEMAGLTRIVDQMHRDYEAVEAEERRAEMMRQQQQQHSSSSSNHSSGGGSWGSGSGGGSSNNGGNSSGGSNW